MKDVKEFLKLRNKRTSIHLQRSKKALLTVLLVSMTSGMVFTGCAGNDVANLSLTHQEEAKVVALLGDLHEDVSKKVEYNLSQLVHKAELMMAKREAQDNYEVTDEEYKLWEDITSLLDKETIRQFGRDNYEEESVDSDLDYGKETMANLKKILNEKDWKQLNEIRDTYFLATESGEQDSYTETEFGIKKIVQKYQGLDVDAITLNLLDDKNQQNFGMFTITPKFDVKYQSGKENGLKVLSTVEQEKLKMVWKQTTDILPKELFANFKYFKVGGDGELGTYAYVIPVDSEGKLWCMTVDPADISEDGLFPYTVVHEMAHYLTLNEKQVEYFKDNIFAYPSDRFADWQCVAREDSYIQAYYKMFWKDIINDWATNPENSYFYYRHQSQFVTGYAATECAEDMAESFSAYVFLDKAPTPETQKKLDFFDGYPELKELKYDILKKVAQNKVYVNPEIEPVYDESVEPAA
ncbi:hypothetical protein [Anaerotignum sp.]|uniref:hypothetical protein n=1 Tax=Anaerotignum sp. TaxID=2039241 RepID=UPI0028AF8B1C|nr:hypothetical protein [Anaerotignum sp.]